ncbi:hypothetical protein M0R45_025140 [Rubus argutus]|uniref:Uncharacterized protein n=1 Tax=Rubus argutus TaxID=59490 RepID=A0AAW1WTN6_RUBAR
MRMKPPSKSCHHATLRGTEHAVAGSFTCAVSVHHLSSQQHHHIRSFPTTSCSIPNHHWKLFWTSYNFTEPEETNNNRLAFSRPLKSGILAVLPEPVSPPQAVSPFVIQANPFDSEAPLCRVKPLTLAVRPSPHSRRFQQHSTPMKVPVLSNAMIMEWRSNLGDLVDVADDGDGGNEEILQPHELPHSAHPGIMAPIGATDAKSTRIRSIRST